MTNWVYGSPNSVHLSVDDRARMREVIRKWGKGENIVAQYDDSLLEKHLKCWQVFVEFEWDEGWDISEYDHDLGCRYWLQLAIENTAVETREKIMRLVEPMDAVFKRRMTPLQSPNFDVKPGVFAGHPYFWETNTIYRIPGNRKQMI